MDGSKLLGLLALMFTITNPLKLSAASISPGDLIISEVMANPAAVSDANGEWFEIYNLTGNSLDLNGITLSDSGSNLHVVDFAGPLTISSHDYLVFGRGGVASANGGYAADYVYSDFTLSNSSDDIILSAGGVEIVRLEYASGFAVAGVSRELTGTVGPLLDGVDYVLSISPYGDGDIGTPGAAGDSSWTQTPKPVPVPAAIWLLGSGLVGLLGVVGRRDKTGCNSG
ncbi:MAG: lamin tail domain-containing protein [Gammaproteobacteria bacterium]|nr:lamin tail domain-containing protein [Gammaproteobacteria bacterium]